MDIATIISLLIAPLTGIVSWLAARRVRNSNTLQKMQETIDLLVERNNQLYRQLADVNHQLVQVRRENAELKTIITAKKTTKTARKNEQQQ